MTFGQEKHVVKHTSGQKTTAIDKEQIIQGNDFSAFLCMGRWKYQGSLKFFLRHTSYLRGLLVQSTEFLILFHPEFLQVQRCSATTVANFILVELDREQHSLFHSSLCSAARHCNLKKTVIPLQPTHTHMCAHAPLFHYQQEEIKNILSSKFL